MKAFRDGVIIAFCWIMIFAVVGLSLDMHSISSNIERSTDNIERATNYILSTQEIVSGQDESIKELRHITDEFRSQIKGLQKEVFVGVQKEGL